jgi:hypothetical protein
LSKKRRAEKMTVHFCIFAAHKNSIPEVKDSRQKLDVLKGNSWDQCYDSQNVFAKKWRFGLQTLLVYAKIGPYVGFQEKNSRNGDYSINP